MGEFTAKEELIEMLREFLTEEGYVPRLDDDGDIVFKYEGGKYYIWIDEDDLEFVKIIYPAFWSIESDQERTHVVQAATFATRNTKVAKVFPVRDETYATVEMFCSPVENIKPVLLRSVRALRTAVTSFRERMLELRDEALESEDEYPA